MINLKTQYAGLTLQSPIIVSSSGLTNNAERNKEFEKAGAGAIVLKSLFEEQMEMQSDAMLQESDYPEAADYIRGYVKANQVENYLELIRKSKELCTIPIIASINCYRADTWIEFAKQLQDAGADAIELNVFFLETDIHHSCEDLYQLYTQILKKVKQVVTIPVIIKLGKYISNMPALVNQLKANGADGVVLFNRFYQPDINIEKMEHISGEIFSNASDLAIPLRWIGIASAVVDKIDYAASGGVANAESVVKAILAGASAVEVCSAVYLNTNAFIGEANRFLSAWMERKGFENIAQFKGKLNIKDVQGVNTFERTQFLKYFGKKE